MKATASFSRARRAFRPAACAVPLLAAAFWGCMPPGDRLAGGSTEAGNAGGKLSLADGRPASGVEVVLVAREFRPDSARPASPGNLEGAYYRTRTGADGSYAFAGVEPGGYRVMALDAGAGATADSIAIAEGDTAVVERVMKPLGAIRGVAKVVGAASKVNVWVRSKATLQCIRLADEVGGFRLDSLPEGEYDLEPLCFTCRPVDKPLRVRVGAGRDTLLGDTLKLYPGYFQAFPAAGDITLRSAHLPFLIAGKTHRGNQDSDVPLSAQWTWDGAPVAAELTEGGGGISGTGLRVDSSFFRERRSGVLRLELVFADTAVMREWRISLDAGGPAWAMRIVRAGRREPLIDGAHPVWRFRILAAEAPDPADVAFWGLEPGMSGEAPPMDVGLTVDPDDGQVLKGEGEITFILVPDSAFGGRVFRPRADERLEDFRAIRLLDRARLGFAGNLAPHMMPAGLRIDRVRGDGSAQRYFIAAEGTIAETLAFPAKAGDGEAGPIPDSLLLFYRRAPAGTAFAWDVPLRGAGPAWAIDMRGRVRRLDSGAAPAMRTLDAASLAALRGLLAPMAGDPPSLPDDADRPLDAPWAYAWHQGRGRLAPADSDSLLAALGLWLERNARAEVPSFALPDSVPWRYLSFRADSSGWRHTGDTLILERDTIAADRFREFLTAGSPGQTADSSVYVFALRIEGDSLVAASAPGGGSRLFGKIGSATRLFALTRLVPIEPGVQFGLPAPTGGDPDLSGLWAGARDLGDRIVESPGLRFQSKRNGNGARDGGWLYTGRGGLERQWSFTAGHTAADVWDKR